MRRTPTSASAVCEPFGWGRLDTTRMALSTATRRVSAATSGARRSGFCRVRSPLAHQADFVGALREDHGARVQDGQNLGHRREPGRATCVRTPPTHRGDIDKGGRRRGRLDGVGAPILLDKAVGKGDPFVVGAVRLQDFDKMDRRRPGHPALAGPFARYRNRQVNARGRRLHAAGLRDHRPGNAGRRRHGRPSPAGRRGAGRRQRCRQAGLRADGGGACEEGSKAHDDTQHDQAPSVSHPRGGRSFPGVRRPQG
jgi:hypothetical protein